MSASPRLYPPTLRSFTSLSLQSPVAALARFQPQGGQPPTELDLPPSCPSRPGRKWQSLMKPSPPSRSAAVWTFRPLPRLSLAIGLSLVGLLTGGLGATQGAEIDFPSQIAPILEQRCIRCHYPGNSQGDVSLATMADLQSHGYVTPGDPDGSYLLELISADEGQAPAMPQDGQPLTDAELALVRQWIEQGAKWPEEVIVREKPLADASHWSLQPLAKVEGDSLDEFIQAKLAEKQLALNPPADRRTLIRRATFDLIGLPPTPEEVEAFVNDDDPQAYQRLIDRLLASPHYGERWGRHWLDVARYSDSNGLDENVAHGNAWRYRDWVIAAFNQDKPYDQFLREQIAGDLLEAESEAERNELLIATGFLTLGPKVLAESDKQKLQMDIVDEQIDTLGKATMGLTIGCARCHDHKFDPITAEDYYALAGIFTSTQTMESLKTVAKWHENPVATQAEIEARDAHLAKVEAKKQEIQKAVAAETARLTDEGVDLGMKPEEKFSADAKQQLQDLRGELAELEKQTPELPTAMGVTEGEVANIAVHLGGSHLSLGDEVERGVPAVLNSVEPVSISTASSGRLELARWITSPDHPLTARVMVNRLWRWHFGEGLVRTPDNFGILGEKPTHPELLDWLAAELIRKGWSLKQMHRLIMLSDTYRQSSGPDLQGVAVDPDNRLWWRQNVRRLEAEAIRDAVLAVSGQLDRTMGGSHLHVANRGYLFDHTSKDGTSYDTKQRSVYLPVIRNNLFDGFALFDYADASTPNGDRPTSTVATQALYVLNSQLFLEAAEALAAQVAKEAAQPEERFERLSQLAWGRSVSEQERQLFTQFLQEVAEQDLQPSETSVADPAWVALCQMILASNEFIYVR